MLVLFFFASMFSLFHEPDCFEMVDFIEGHQNSAIDITDQFVLSTYRVETPLYSGEIIADSVTYFNSLGNLKDLYDCEYSFGNYQYTIRGYIKTISFEDDSSGLVLSMDFIYIQSQNIVIAELDDGIYSIKRCMATSEYQTPAFVIDAIDTSYITVQTGYPEDFMMPEVKPAEFETVSELVLAKEASLDIKITPAVHETVTELVLSRESNVCPELPTTYDTLTEQVLVNEGGSELTVIPAVFEMVTEQVLAHDHYNDFLVESPTIQTDTLDILLNVDLKYYTKEFSPGDCFPHSLEDCITFENIIIPGRDTTLIEIKYHCPDGYELLDNICYKEVDVPAEYTTRSYEKLVTPTTTHVTEVPAEYDERDFILISNKDELPDSCIQIIAIERQWEKLVMPATSETTDVDAEYELRTYEKLVTPATIESQDNRQDKSVICLKSQNHIPETKQISSFKPSFYIEDINDIISQRLNELGYNESNYYENYIHYLCDNSIAISIPTKNILDQLDIEISTINDDPNVGNLELDFFHTIVAPFNEQIPTFVSYKVLDKDCETQIYSTSVSDFNIDNPDELYVYNGGDTLYKIISKYPETEKLIYIDPVTDAEHLIYDMSVTDCDQKWPVTHVDPDTLLDIRQIFETLDGRKVIELDILLNNCVAEDQYLQFIEGIGTNAGPIYDIQNGKVTSTLLCMSSNLGFLYKNPFSESCTVATTNPGIYDDQYLYPNPTSGIFTIPLEYKCQAVWNTLGKPIQFTNSGNEINISSSPRGLYTVRLVSSSKTVDMKIVKI